MTAREIARWMAAQVSKGYLYRDAAAQKIAAKFGSEFTYINENGNPAISRQVLREFLKITTDTVVWSTSERAWRKRESYDGLGRQQD